MFANEIIYRMFDLYTTLRHKWLYVAEQKTKAANDYERRMWDEIARADFHRMRGVENVFSTLGIDYFVLLDAFAMYDRNADEETFNKCVEELTFNLH